MLLLMLVFRTKQDHLCPIGKIIVNKDGIITVTNDFHNHAVLREIF